MQMPAQSQRKNRMKLIALGNAALLFSKACSIPPELGRDGGDGPHHNSAVTQLPRTSAGCKEEKQDPSTGAAVLAEITPLSSHAVLPPSRPLLGNLYSPDGLKMTFLPPLVSREKKEFEIICWLSVLHHTQLVLEQQRGVILTQNTVGFSASPPAPSPHPRSSIDGSVCSTTTMARTHPDPTSCPKEQDAFFSICSSLPYAPMQSC